MIEDPQAVAVADEIQVAEAADVEEVVLEGDLKRVLQLKSVVSNIIQSCIILGSQGVDFVLIFRGWNL
jgi:hypothetical protein